MKGSPATRRPLSGADSQDRNIVDPPFVPSTGVSMVVGRALGTVVVTVHGDVDRLGGEFLDAVLADLIDDQGNLAVEVDLTQASLAAGTERVLVAAVGRARRHGAKFIVREPPLHTLAALQRSEFADTIEIQARKDHRSDPGAGGR
ncbi:MAG: hypothetical protein M3083_22150 [Actinomycetota bacterium]|nr:hypothetical protein [Actinomycetota bacterium]